MINKETFNKYKKILKIKGEFPFSDKNVKELMYKFYKYVRKFINEILLNNVYI